MLDPFHVLSAYFWVVALALSAFNCWKAGQSSAMSTLAPDKVFAARAYLRKFAIASAIPWVIMGVGQLTGLTPTVWHYFRPQDGNVFVLAWLAAIFTLSGVFAWWVWLADGAKKVVELNLLAALGQRGAKPPSERVAKLFAALGVVIVPIWVYGAISMNAPIPR
jgi:hypothetical protein